MKKIILFSITAVTALILVLNSCKKADIKPTTMLDDETAISKIKQNVARQIEKEGGIPQIFNNRQKVQTMWIDQFKNPLTKEQMQNSNFTSACSFNTPSSCNLVQYSRVYRCAGSGLGGPGYFLQFVFELDWNNNIVASGSGGVKTSGFVDIVSDATSNVVQSLTFDATNSDVHITEVGPVGGGYYHWRVEFITTDFNTHLVPAGYINGDAGGTYTVKLSAQFVTDCKNGDLSYSLWLLPVTAYGFTGSSGNDPCQRNEKAWPDFSVGGSYSNRIAIAGYNATLLTTCGYGSPFNEPDLQEVQYSSNGGASWNNFTNDITAGNTLGIYNTAFIRKDDIARSATFSSGTYDIIIRYRNWKYVGTNPSGWPVPSGTNDCFSPGDNPSNNTSSTTYSTYAYAYYPGVTF